MIAWEQFGKDWVALDGDNIVGVVSRIDKESGIPCEAFTFQSLHDVYLTANAAKSRLEEVRAKTPEHPMGGGIDMQQVLAPLVDAMKSVGAAPRSIVLGLPCPYCQQNGPRPPDAAVHTDPTCVFLLPGVYDRALASWPSGAANEKLPPAAVEAPAPLPGQ